jgi:hypothetical protein
MKQWVRSGTTKFVEEMSRRIRRDKISNEYKPHCRKSAFWALFELQEQSKGEPA